MEDTLTPWTSGAKDASGGLGERHFCAWKSVPPQQAHCRVPGLSLLAGARLDMPRVVAFTPDNRRCTRPIEEQDTG